MQRGTENKPVMTQQHLELACHQNCFCRRMQSHLTLRSRCRFLLNMSAPDELDFWLCACLHTHSCHEVSAAPTQSPTLQVNSSTGGDSKLYTPHFLCSQGYGLVDNSGAQGRQASEHLFVSMFRTWLLEQVLLVWYHACHEPVLHTFTIARMHQPVL